MENSENRIERIAKKITAMSHFGSYGGFDFYIKSKDLYEDAHVHAEKNNKVVKFWLDPVVKLFKSKRKICPFNQSELNDCTELTEIHRAEFLTKFRNEQKKNGIDPNPKRKNQSQKSSAEIIVAYAIDKQTLIRLPLIGNLLEKIKRTWVENTICDRKSCVISFCPNRKNHKPWLEICFFKNQQHVDFEIVTANEGDEKFFDYEVFVTERNENEVIKKILNELTRFYSQP